MHFIYKHSGVKLIKKKSTPISSIIIMSRATDS